MPTRSDQLGHRERGNFHEMHPQQNAGMTVAGDIEKKRRIANLSIWDPFFHLSHAAPDLLRRPSSTKSSLERAWPLYRRYTCTLVSAVHKCVKSLLCGKSQ